MSKEGSDGQEKTEQPTTRRLRKARQEGQVGQSQEINFVAGLMAVLIYFVLQGSSMIRSIRLLFEEILSDASLLHVNQMTTAFLVSTYIRKMLIILLPLMLLIVVVAVLSNIFQIGFLFTTKPFVPNLKKLNPVSGIKKLFSFGKLVDLVKQVLKLLIVCIVPYFIVSDEMNRLPLIMDSSIISIMTYIGSIMIKILFYVCIVLLFLALLDLVYQRWKHTHDLMMTKQEVKDEHKQSEGDPKVKARIRRLQMEYLRKAMMDQVPKADVVVTNPVHYAVALRYDRTTMQAPTVTAKGARKLAEKIKSIARNSAVPVIENKSLAQSLYKMVDVGDTIPEELYQAVAEVLAYIYNKRNKQYAAL